MPFNEILKHVGNERDKAKLAVVKVGQLDIRMSQLMVAI